MHIGTQVCECVNAMHVLYHSNVRPLPLSLKEEGMRGCMNEGRMRVGLEERHSEGKMKGLRRRGERGESTLAGQPALGQSMVSHSASVQKMQIV